MKLIINDLLIPVEYDGTDAYVMAISQRLTIDVANISIFKILSKSLDLSNKEQFYYKLSLVVNVHDSFKNSQNIPLYQEPIIRNRIIKNTSERPIIVGFGPAGMFAAIELIDCGIKPIIFERGKKIEERSIDINKFMIDRQLNTESNIQFGEGGAGAYSDGKLFSRRNNNTSYVNRVLKTFIRFGAPNEIEYMSKPHLGLDILCRIVKNIRRYIFERGGEVVNASSDQGMMVLNGMSYSYRSSAFSNAALVVTCRAKRMIINLSAPWPV